MAISIETLQSPPGRLPPNAPNLLLTAQRTAKGNVRLLVTKSNETTLKYMLRLTFRGVKAKGYGAVTLSR